MPRALLSVFQKDVPFLEFARALHDRGWVLVSSGGTAKFLAAAGLPVTDAAAITGEPAMLGHRVVTLHPKIHGGLITGPTQEAEREERGIPRFDLLCVGLYPLEEAIAQPDATEESVLELTDIGGPAMLRSAAKGRRLIVSDPKDYAAALAAVESPDLDSPLLRRMAATTEGRVARYCLDSARFQSHGAIDGFIGERVQECAYGENPWQSPATHFASGSHDLLAVQNFKQLGGNPPSYNNLIDVERLLQTVTHIAAVWDVNRDGIPAIAVVVKHGNPCGAAVSPYRDTAIRNMIAGDPTAIFGGIIMFNFPVDDDAAELLLTHTMPHGERRIINGVMAPAFIGNAVERLERKKGECRFFANPALASLSRHRLDTAPRPRYIRGGWVTQPNYTYVLDLKDPELLHHDPLEEGRTPSLQDEEDIMLAWAVGSTSTSNTISIVRNRMLIGNGVGQKDRWFAAHIAVLLAQRAGHPITGAAAYSDSFFPFPDGAEVLRDAGVQTLLASSGSVRDKSVINAFCRNGRRILTAPDRKIRGFYGH